jgi:hypothetical protein
MTTPVKLLLSAICLITAAGAYLSLSYDGKIGPSFAIAFLGIITAVASWVFPDVVRKSPTSSK